MRGLGFGLLLAACGSATGAPPEQLTELAPRDASFDRALSFDGVDDYASVGTARAPNIKRDQTSMLWFRPDGGDGELQVLFTLKRGEESGFALALDDDVPIALQVYSREDLARAPAAATLGEWHHLAYVIAAENSALYLDGALASTSQGALTNRTPTQGFIGSLDGSSHYFRGALDELRVYERAFSATEVAAATAGQPLDDSELTVLYLPFDEADGARAYDRSGLDNHAELGDGVPELMPARVPH